MTTLAYLIVRKIHDSTYPLNSSLGDFLDTVLLISSRSKSNKISVRYGIELNKAIVNVLAMFLMSVLEKLGLSSIEWIMANRNRLS